MPELPKELKEVVTIIDDVKLTQKGDQIHCDRVGKTYKPLEFALIPTISVNKEEAEAMFPRKLEESFKDIFGSDEDDSNVAISGVHTKASE